MQKKHAYIYIAFIIVLGTGCAKNWLDAKPEGSLAIPRTTSDFRAMLDNASLFVTSAPNLGEIASDQDTIPDSGWGSLANSTNGNAYIWQENVPYENITEWVMPYNAIFVTNVVLEGLSKLNDADEKVRALKGEASFQRGCLLYNLATLFSRPYNENNLNDEYGIPIPIKSDLEIPTTRATVGQTYDQIIADIKTAVNLLPLSSDQVTHPVRKSAVGLLARIYLSIEKYDSAYKYSDIYLKSNSIILDFNSLLLSDSFMGLNIEVGSVSFLRGTTMSRFFIPTSLFNKYEENDLRSKAFFRITNGLRAFKGSYSRRATDFFAGVATDEMYLIKAECLARKGDYASAMKWLNDLVRTRYRTVDGITTYVDKTPQNEDEALTIILEERAKQLLRRNVRWSDLRRLNKDPRFATTLTRTVEGKTYTLEPNSDRYTFPIPRDVVNKTNIKQNPGW